MGAKGQAAFQAMLRENFTRAQLKNPAYSLRAYAKQVGISPGALSQALKGKRAFSKKLAEKICGNLLLSPDKRQAVLKALDKKQAGEEKLEYSELSSDAFHAISDWEHFALISLLETKLKEHDSPSLSELLSLSEQKVKDALERLIRLKLIKRLPSGRYVKLHTRLKTSDEISNLSLKKAHLQSFEKAKESLLRDDISTRDMTAITMAIDPKRLAVAKEMIRNFQDRVSIFLESGNKSQVYELCIQLYPLSKNISKIKRGKK